LVPAIGGLTAGIRIVLIACGLIQPDGVHALRYTLAGVLESVVVVRDFRFGQRVGLLAASASRFVGVARRQQEELKRLEGLQQTVRETAKSQLDAVKEEMRRQEAARLEAEKAAAAKKEAEARLNQPKETQKQEQKPAPSKEVPKQEQQKPAPIQAPASTQKPETVK